MTGFAPWHQHASVRIRRKGALQRFGFTATQAVFVNYVLAFSGVFLERQYRQFTGLVHGQKTHDFLTSLVDRGYAHVITPGALHRGRLFHLHHKPLYEAIEDPDNRHRKPASLARYVERLMILDAVLADQRYAWLGTERDKVRYFLALLEKDLRQDWYPHLAFGEGRDRVLRYFPDKMPIGIPHDGVRRHAFLYVVTRDVPSGFRDFLLRHTNLFRHLNEWTIRVVVPRRFRRAAALYRYAIRDFLRPVSAVEHDELQWYFETRAGRATTRRAPYGLDLKKAAAKFKSGRFEAIYRAWLQDGDMALSNARSTILHDQFVYGQVRIEFAGLPYQYLQLTPLLQSTGVHKPAIDGQTTYDPNRLSSAVPTASVSVDAADRADDGISAP